MTGDQAWKGINCTLFSGKLEFFNKLLSLKCQYFVILHLSPIIIGIKPRI